MPTPASPRPISLGGSGRGGITLTTVDSTETRVFGRPISVVYGTASVKGALLTSADMGSNFYEPDGSPRSWPALPKPGAAVQVGWCFGPNVTVKSIAYEDWLYGDGGVDFKFLGHLTALSTYNPPTFTDGDPDTVTIWTPYIFGSSPYRVPFGHVAVMRVERLFCSNGWAKISDLTATVEGLFATHENTSRTLAGGHPMDAHPLDVIVDLLENDIYGVGLPAGTVSGELGSDGTAASSYRNHCQARGYWVALSIQNSESVADVVAQLLLATNAIAYWEGSTFRVIPLADTGATGNSLTYTPDLRALDVSDDDILLDGENEPITVRRAGWDSVSNVVPVKWSSITTKLDANGNQYQDDELIMSEEADSSLLGVYGLRRGEVALLPCIRSEAHALEVSRILARRSCYNRSTFEFRVSQRLGAILCPGDLLSLTHEAMTLVSQLVRVTSTDEGPDGVVTVNAVEWPTDATIAVWRLPHDTDGN